MNPPFSAVAHVDRMMKDAALRHIASALARLAPGGRLVAITGASCAPDNPAWSDAFARLQERGRVVFSAAIDGQVYAKHGTTIDTRLTVIDRVPAADPNAFPVSPGVAPDRSEEHTSELQSLMRISYAVFCLKTKTKRTRQVRERRPKKNNG